MSKLNELNKQLSKLKKDLDKEIEEIEKKIEEKKVQKKELSFYNNKIRKRRRIFWYGYFIFIFIVIFAEEASDELFGFKIDLSLVYPIPLLVRFFHEYFKFKEPVSALKESRQHSLHIDKRGIERNISKIEREIQLRKKYPEESDSVISLMMMRSFYVGMSREQLIDSKGRPEDIKSSHKNNVETEKFYYGGRTTRVKTTKYSLEITLKNNEIVGYKELE